MKIKITELGAIKEATIDLGKKLTVFCGPNGTGKTYLSFVIYAITSLRNKSFGIRLNKELINKLISENEIVIPIKIDDIWNFRNAEIEKIKNNLWNLFAVAESKKDTYFGKTTISILESKEDFEERIDSMSYEWDIKLDNSYSFKIAKIENSKSLTVWIKDDIIKDDGLISYLDIVLLSRLYSLLTFFPISSSTAFPVERNSIFTFSNELSIRKNDRSDLLQKLVSNKDVRPIDLILGGKTRYPQPIKDALSVADDLEQVQKGKSVYFEFAEIIETELLKGKILISKEGSVEFKSDKAKGISLSFHQSSSIVKTLASLVIYLKHIAVENDLIIIDEPELNLHPNNQILLAKIFGRLIHKGLRLVISTHSDYIIRELNNLLMISQGNEEVKELSIGLGYNIEESLNTEDVEIYMFDYKNIKALKTEVTSIKVGKSGFSVKSIDDTIEKQNEIAEQLYYTLKYGKAD